MSRQAFCGQGPRSSSQALCHDRDKHVDSEDTLAQQNETLWSLLDHFHYSIDILDQEEFRWSSPEHCSTQSQEQEHRNPQDDSTQAGCLCCRRAYAETISSDSWDATIISTPAAQPRKSAVVSRTIPEQSWRKHRLQKCIHYFGDSIVQMIASQPWFESATLFHSPEFIDRNISVALKRFTEDLVQRLPRMGEEFDNTSVDARRLIAHFRRRIARYIRINSQKIYGDPEVRKSTLGGDTKHTAPIEVVTMLDAFGLSKDMVSELSDNKRRLKGSLDADDADVFLFNSPPFSNFCLDLRRRLYDVASPILAYTRATVLGLFQTLDSSTGGQTSLDADEEDIHSVLIRTDWKPLDFMTAQYGSNPPPIGSVIAYTGFASCAVASTCSDYLRKWWASTSAIFLQGLQQLLDSDDHQWEWAVIDAQLVPLLLSMKLSRHGYLLVRVASTPNIVVQITQQVLWISSALRLAPDTGESRRLYSNGFVETRMPNPESKTGFCLYVSCRFEEVPRGEESCWLELVDQSAVLCHHFPVPSRSCEKGLEIPLQMICQLAGFQHAVEFEGGVVIKAPSAMLVPISRTDDIVQWHFIVSLDENQRLTYQDGLDQCRTRALVDLVDFEALRYTRAVVGWCKLARKVIGREDADYSDIDYSTAALASSSVNFSGAVIGFQQFGVAQLDFKMGPKDSKVVFQRSGNFAKILRLAERQHLVLHDTDDKRAWLVNADDVILHVVQTRILKNPLTSRGVPRKKLRLQYQESASKTLRLNEMRQVSDEDETVTSVVMSTWSMLEMLLDQVVQTDQSAERPIRLPSQKSLVGFELMGIVEERSPLNKKEYNMKDASGGWTRLIKDSSTLVLFAKGLKDLIATDNTSKDACEAWRTMPKGKNYLGTTVPVLMDLYATAGSRYKLQHLTRSGLYWRSENSPFGPCQNTSSPCSCNRLQDIAHSDGNPAAAPKVEDNGGVVFGKPSSYSGSLHTLNKPQDGKMETAKPQGKRLLYMQTNGPISPMVPDDKSSSSIKKQTCREEDGGQDISKEKDAGQECFNQKDGDKENAEQKDGDQESSKEKTEGQESVKKEDASQNDAEGENRSQKDAKEEDKSQESAKEKDVVELPHKGFKRRM